MDQATPTHPKVHPMRHDDEIVRCISKRPEVRIAIVFGSIAAGRQKPDSDLDLGVAGPRALSATEKVELVGALAQSTGRAIDLVDLTTATGPLLSRILSTGWLVHCADRGLYAELIKRAIYDDADLAPYRQRILEAQRRRWIAA